MDRKERAVEFKHNAHNCCQAVICAYAEDLGLTQEFARKIGAAFGSGMGTMEGTCGALAGAGMVLGLNKYDGKHMGKDAAALSRSFAAKCGAVLCKDLKGIETGKMLCSCDDCVRNAVEALEEFL